MLEEVPSVDGGATVLDIVTLLETIAKRGGVRRVQDQSLWKEVSFLFTVQCRQRCVLLSRATSLTCVFDWLPV